MQVLYLTQGQNTKESSIYSNSNYFLLQKYIDIKTVTIYT